MYEIVMLTPAYIDNSPLTTALKYLKNKVGIDTKRT